MRIFITGVTGFLGGELLVELAAREDVKIIYCLIRAQSEDNAYARLIKVFQLHDNFYDADKVIPILGDLADEGLGDALMNDPRLNEVNTVIHSAANTSFSRIYDDIVETINIGGTRQILRWAKSLKNLDVFTYVGTAAICGSNVKNAVISEGNALNTKAKHLVKYSYTKMVGEMMLKDYLPEDKILVVRPSIIMGDSRNWTPRSYVILWALAALNQMRLFPVNAQSNIDIISIDYAVAAIIALLVNKNRKYNIYHISAGIASATTPEKVTDTIKRRVVARPEYRFVDKSLLTSMKKWSKNSISIDDDDPLHDHKDYLAYWLDYFGDNRKLRILFYALEPYINFIELGQIFDNSRLLEDTNISPSIPAHEYVVNSVKYIDLINVFEGAIDP